MEYTAFFTDEEKQRLTELYRTMLEQTADVFRPEDQDLVRRYLRESVEQGYLGRDVFGLNPVINGMETAFIVATEIGHMRTAILGSILQACCLSGYCSEEQVSRDFGPEVGTIIHGLTRIQELYRKNASIESEHFRSLLLSFAEDMRVILIMIADRVNLMRKIKDAEAEEARQRVSAEAAYLYAPLAHKLGLYKLKSELEDLSLKYREHEAYYHIKEKLNETKRSRDQYVEQFIAPVKEKLDEAGLKYHMKGRTKSIHSIYQKMKKQHCDVEGIYDLFAIRIILDSKPKREKLECWQVYSILADMYQPNPKRMRDWLTIPKSNGYESLHITVLGPQQKWVEVQIRTERMDEVAERGLAAHWRYKGVKSGESGVENWLKNIRSALEVGDDMQLMDQFKMDLYEDEVFVFTPRGDLFKMPKGSTVLDFAYHIHSNVGNRCVGGRIGERNVSLRHQLQSGDQVEILTQNNQTPKQDWLNIVATSHAKSKIRQALKEVMVKQSAYGKELLERKFRNHKIEYEESLLARLIARRGYKVGTEFYKDIAEERLSVNDLMAEYQAMQRKENEVQPATTVSAEQYSIETDAQRKASAGGDDVLVIDQNLKGLDFSLAKCCHPVYGDEVFGFVTTGGGIKIHRADCPNAPQLQNRFGYRIVRAKWSGKGGGQYAITLRVIGHDDIGIVNNITSIISKEEKISLRSISIDSNDGLFSGTLTVMIDDTNRLQSLMKKIRTVKGVKSVTRV